jgi:hypothetical protein
MTLTATYSLNGGAATAIPGGIFTKPSQFIIEANPTSPANVGTYTISLTVSDTSLTVTSSFVVTVANTPPRFTGTLPSHTLSVNSLGSYDISALFVDDDGNPLTMTATSSFAGATALTLPAGILTLPTWSTVAIAPTLMTEVGIYLITLTVSDSLAAVSSSFQISVVNTPPYFLSTVPDDFTMKFNNTHVFFIPKFQDDEGHAVTVVLDSIPAG